MRFRIGTSGWVYPHWRGVFYPQELRQPDWFSYYAGQFDTVEINNTFYRLPGENAFDVWRKQAPPGFLYAIKASRYLTHMKKLKEPEEPLHTFFERAARLGETLGPVLYQLPPHWRVDLNRFEQFLSLLPGKFSHVIEFREPSWLTEPVFSLMERFGVAHCIHDMYPLEIPARVTAPLVYVRLHGDVRHRGCYPAAALETWAKRLSDWREAYPSVFLYFNNDRNGYAVENARALRQLLGEENTQR